MMSEKAKMSMRSCHSTKRQMNHASGSDATISNVPVSARKSEPTLNQMYAHTKMSARTESSTP